MPKMTISSYPVYYNELSCARKDIWRNQQATADKMGELSSAVNENIIKNTHDDCHYGYDVNKG